MGKFVIKETANGGFKFDLKAGNGEVIASSQIYKSEKACKAGVESVRNNALAEVEDQTVENFEVKKHPKYEMYTDKRGEVRFRLKAKNGEIIATSEGYKKKASALNGIESIKRNAPEATVVKLTPEVFARIPQKQIVTRGKLLDERRSLRNVPHVPSEQGGRTETLV